MCPNVDFYAVSLIFLRSLLIEGIVVDESVLCGDI